MSQDDLDHIPSIVPTRDLEPQRSSGKARSGKPEAARGSGKPRNTAPAGGAGWLSRVLVAVALVVAVSACGWAWYLQTGLARANDSLADYAERIGELEARLSDTDEGMSQNAAVQAAKISHLESEVRKLWDNVWKEARERLGKLETANTGQDKSINDLKASLSSSQAQLKKVSEDIARFNNVAEDISRLMTSARANQAEVERVADSLNRIELALTRLDKRVASNEEWVGSVNAFRQQVNSSLTELQAAVRSLQAAP